MQKVKNGVGILVSLVAVGLLLWATSPGSMPTPTENDDSRTVEILFTWIEGVPVDVHWVIDGRGRAEPTSTRGEFTVSQANWQGHAYALAYTVKSDMAKLKCVIKVDGLIVKQDGGHHFSDRVRCEVSL